MLTWSKVRLKNRVSVTSSNSSVVWGGVGLDGVVVVVVVVVVSRSSSRNRTAEIY